MTAPTSDRAALVERLKKKAAESWTICMHVADYACPPERGVLLTPAEYADVLAALEQDAARHVYTFVCSCGDEFDSLEQHEAHFQTVHTEGNAHD